MAAAEGKNMNLSSRNWLFDSDGEFHIYLNMRWQILICKYFGHSKENFDQWHCDRCYGCLEHETQECEY